MSRPSHSSLLTWLQYVKLLLIVTIIYRNPHNYSKWDSHVTRRWDYKLTVCHNVVSAKKLLYLMFSKKKVAFLRVWSIKDLSSFSLLWKTDCKWVSKNCTFTSEMSFSGTSTKLQKTNISFVMSVCPLVANRLPLNGFSWNLVLNIFLKIYQENSSFINIWQEKRVLYIKISTQFWSYLAHFSFKWEMLQTNVIEKIKINILFSINFFWK